MGMAVGGYDGQTLTVRAPLAANRNLHGTAFAGSLFSACVLTGWGAVWLALRERGLSALDLAADSTSNIAKAVDRRPRLPLHRSMPTHCVPGSSNSRRRGARASSSVCTIEPTTSSP